MGEAQRIGDSSAALVAHSISKRFGGQQALNRVDLVVRKGVVHSLLGENGSGKSTLIKILAGYHAPDGGELAIGGDRVELPLQPGQFRSLGLEFVHQDLGLIPSLSVLENLRFGELAEPKRPWWISWRREATRARETLARYRLTLDPMANVSDLTPLERALLAIVRAMEGMRESVAAHDRRSGVLVLDEPTVFLPRSDTERLFELVREIARGGSSVIFVSHDLDEALEVSDWITVLRDGRVVDTVRSSDVTKRALIEMIIGRSLTDLTGTGPRAFGATSRLSVKGLNGRRLRDVDLEAREGEVVGLTGLVGSGFEDMPYVVSGVQRCSGILHLDGAQFDLAHMSPLRAARAGIAVIPGDRKRDGSVASVSATDNMMLPVLRQYFGHGILRTRTMSRDAARLMEEFDVRPRQPELPYAAFSGGNQQKALLAKWLQTKPRILVLHEPTQGVDVGARTQIFQVIRETASGGTTVLCVSSDYEQLAIVCHRVVIFADGRVIQELSGEEVTKERITEQCYSSLT